MENVLSKLEEIRNQHKEKPYYKFAEAVIMIVLVVGQLYYVVCGQVDGYGFVHLFLFPVIIVGLLGKKRGRICNWGMFVLVTVILWTDFLKPVAFYDKRLRTAITFAMILVNILNEFLIYQKNTSMRVRADLEAERKKTDAQKAEFLANMSHEFKTPMNAILGMCELIEKDVSSGSEIMQKCDRIRQSGNSLMEMINDVLDYSEIAFGSVESVEEPFNMEKTIEAVNQKVAMSRKKRNVDYFVAVDPKLPRGLIGDERRIRQIMVNLVSNGLKFTNFGGVCLNVGFSKREYGINLQIMVEDTGIGIERDKQKQIFEAFAQLDSAGNRKEEGRGLGLAICKRLVSNMRGFIYVKSRLHEGSHFHVTIPMNIYDELPIIDVDTSKECKVWCFVDLTQYASVRVRARYRRILREIGELLHIPYAYFEEEEKFKEQISTLGDSSDYCFVSAFDLRKEPNFYEKLAEKMRVVVIRDIDDYDTLPKGVYYVYTPFHVASVAKVLNGELTANDKTEVKTETFTAPDYTVLIVDDNPVNLMLAAGFLTPYEVRIVSASSGFEALSILEKKEINLVFMDYMMPEMDGIETFHMLRKRRDEYSKQVPVVALSANAVAGARDMFIGEGFTDYLDKPITAVGIFAIMDRFVPKEKRYNAKEAVLIDREQGLVYTGNEETYYGVLESFVRNGESSLKSMTQLYEEQNFKDYVILVHGIKSTAMSIGAGLLSEKAKFLELSGKEENYSAIHQNHEDTKKLYEEVLAYGQSILVEKGLWKEEEKEVPKEYEEITKEELKETVDALIDACEQYDCDESLLIISKLKNKKRNEFSLYDYYNRIRELLEDYEFRKALEMIHTLQDEIEDCPDDGK